MKKSIYIILSIFGFIFLEEIIFSIFTYNSFSIYTFLFTIIFSLLIYIIYSLIKDKKILYIFSSIILLIFISNYLYYSLYSTFITIDVLLNSSKIYLFYNNIFNVFMDCFYIILLFFIPFILFVYLINKINIKKYFFKYSFICFVCFYIITLLLLNFDNKYLYSSGNLYFNINFNIKNLSNFGLLNSIRINIQRSLFGFDEHKVIVNDNNSSYSIDEYNILDIDFKTSDNENINEINNYLENSIPSKKNIYTGIFEGKNMIFILAESFNSIAINSELTPSLYKIYNEGFKFNNFYNPLYPVSTADGQYLTDISLFPSDSSMSLKDVNDNYIPYSLANIFKSNGYKTYSYHNYKYNYYDRDKYYKNMGFDNYKAIGNGLNMEDNQSDFDMVKSSINEYINDENFFAYYLTMSGHAPYNNSNKVSSKNIYMLDNYHYSDSVKHYIATQIELDKMVEYILKTLKEKNKIDDTVIVLVPDHIPFGLDIDEMNELSGEELENEFSKYKSEFIIYNEKINRYKNSDNYAFNIDVLPTLLNLFGISYDSRLLMGRDALSSDSGMVIFGNRNILTKDFKYSNMKDFIYGNISNEEIDIIKQDIYFKFRISRLILEEDYYKYLFK